MFMEIIIYKMETNYRDCLFYIYINVIYVKTFKEMYIKYQL